MVDANIGAPLSDTKFRWSKTSIECLVISQLHMFSQLVFVNSQVRTTACRSTLLVN